MLFEPTLCGTPDAAALTDDCMLICMQLYKPQTRTDFPKTAPPPPTTHAAPSAAPAAPSAACLRCAALPAVGCGPRRKALSGTPSPEPPLHPLLAANEPNMHSLQPSSPMQRLLCRRRRRLLLMLARRCRGGRIRCGLPSVLRPQWRRARRQSRRPVQHQWHIERIGAPKIVVHTAWISHLAAGAQPAELGRVGHLRQGRRWRRRRRLECAISGCWLLISARCTAVATPAVAA